jgi:protein SCO1/2
MTQRFSKFGRTKLAALFALMLAASIAQAQFYSEPKPLAPVGKPKGIEGIAIDQHLNQQLPLDAAFSDENGKAVKLGDYFGEKPVIIVPMYYTCPMLCSEVESGLISALGVLKLTPGKEFNVVSVTMNPNETPQDAMVNKNHFLQRYRRPGADWHFLTGPQSSITPVMQALGFHYNYDPETKQYYHATAIMVATPQGKIAQYFYGIEFPPNDLRLALVDSSHEKIGNVADALLLYCFHYDPKTGKYSAQILNILRVMGLVTFGMLAGFMVMSLRRERKHKTAAAVEWHGGGRRKI